ncbi:ABC transporter permease [Methyloraptor flagellatus]|uniref:ABC transporter permease n=1 Tax=Methyloraptor flagellatus TaxID=3162530 RepID=A0AAU7XF89_9HYPH
MASALVGRLAAMVPVLLTVAATVFLLLRIGIGDPAASMAGDAASTAQLAAIRTQFGLDQPVAVQFATWLGHAARGDLGTSFYFRVPVADLIGERFGPTVSLAALTLAVAVALGVPLGVAAANRRGRWLDRTLMGFTVVGFSAPSFVVAYACVYIFAIRLGWLPVQGYAPLSAGLGTWLAHLVLPVLSLAPVYVAVIARMTRASVAETLGEDYVRTARAKGAAPVRVLLRHALPNAAAPVLTVIGVAIGLLMGGVVVIENVFNLPGLGRLVVDSVVAGDYPVVQGAILVSAVICLGANLAIDIVYGLIDPRIRT